MKTLTFVIDIDDTISEWNDNRDYLNFIPKQNMIDKINIKMIEGLKKS